MPPAKIPADLWWLPQAVADVRDIYVQIGLEQAEAAERFIDSIERNAELMVDQPRLGVRMLVERRSSSSVRQFRMLTNVAQAGYAAST